MLVLGAVRTKHHIGERSGVPNTEAENPHVRLRLTLSELMHRSVIGLRPMEGGS